MKFMNCPFKVLEIVSAVKEEPIEELAETIYNNTRDIFFPDHS